MVDLVERNRQNEYSDTCTKTNTPTKTTVLYDPSGTDIYGPHPPVVPVERPGPFLLGDPCLGVWTESPHGQESNGSDRRGILRLPGKDVLETRGTTETKGFLLSPGHPVNSNPLAYLTPTGGPVPPVLVKGCGVSPKPLLSLSSGVLGN